LHGPPSGPFSLVDFQELSMILMDNRHDISRYYSDISSIYESNGWGAGYTPELLKKMFSATIYRIALVDGVAVGLIRAHSDQVVATYLTELAIHKNHQRKGYGTALTQSFLKDFTKTAIYITAFVENQEFFDKFDLRNKKQKFVIYARKRIAT
jgi:ribosomal protein S18 acetylase RimI-like enzyme